MSDTGQKVAVGSMLTAALTYATRHAWAVFPVHSITLAGACTCGSALCTNVAKHPLTLDGLRAATTDIDQVSEWWRDRWPHANVAVTTGAISDLVVLDIDVQHGGGSSLKALEREHGQLPKTAQALTGNGGAHYLFRHPGFEVRNSAGKLGAGVDVRGDGGYAILAPSQHRSGRRYQWRTPPERGLAALPEWISASSAPRHEPAAPLPVRVPNGSRHYFFVSAVGRLLRHGFSRDAALAALLEENSRLDEPTAARNIENIVDDAYRRWPIGNLSVDFAATDLGNAEAFVALHAERFRFVPQRRQWLAWSEGRWRRDETGESSRAAKRAAQALLRRAAEVADDEKRKQAVRWALSSQSESRIRAMLMLAGTEDGMVASVGDLDADPWLLSARNGTIDLRTGDLREHDPSSMLTLGTEVPYQPDEVTCPRWLRFLQEIFGGDEELIGFVRRAVGYSLTADTREHVLFVLHGGGANGKSTFIETITRVAGGLARTSPFDSFARGRDKGVRNDIARLHRARFVVAAESGEGRRLDEATVKLLTGGDTVAARFLYGEYFEFRPEFKLWLVTNHRPRVEGDDDAIWRRLRLIPFNISFLGREDKQLTPTLEQELPGILAWAVRGCLEWQEHGLGLAEAVATATKEYREDEDVLGAFLEEECVLTGEVVAATLRERYEQFCKGLGEKPLAANSLGRRLARRGVKVERPGGTRTYQGIRLRDAMEPS